MNINKNNKWIIIKPNFMKIRKINFDKYLQIFDKYPREYFVFIFFFIFATIIILKVFDYTVSRYDFYKNLADRQQKTQTSIPVTRWSIYSNNDRWKVLATSVDLNDLAIDPAVEWDKNKLKAFLTDIVYKQNCYLKWDKNCYKDMLKFLHTLEIPEFKFEESYIKWLIWWKIEKDINKKKLTNVLIADTLSQEELEKIKWLNLVWIYVNWLNLYANPEEIVNPKTIATALTTILQEDETNLSYRMRKRELRYIPIISKLSISLYDEIIKKINDEKESIKRWFLTQEKWIWNFIILTPNPNRFYPERFLSSQVLWFLDNWWIGRYGIEWYFNNLLKWKEWSLITKKDTMWRVIDPSTLKQEEIRVAWANITLTIDRNIQKKVEEELEKWVEEFRANKWSVTVMNPKTWEILAMASYPSFDPNEPWDVYEVEKVSYWKYPNPSDLLWKTVLVEDNEHWDELLYDNKKIKLRVATREELYNWALVKYKYTNDYWAWVYMNDTIQNLYEPWSIMKPVTVAAWIDSWEIRRYDLYKDPGYAEVWDYKIKNVSNQCIWLKTFQNALNFSCNVWMLKIADKMWKSLFSKYLSDFWFWKLTWITLEWERTGTMTPYEKWSRAQLFTTSFGQWIVTTPLQMARSYSVIANGWIYMQPYIVKSIKFDDWRIVENKANPVQRVIKETTSKIVRDMLEEWGQVWFAKAGWVPGYKIAGKTGTSQIAYKWTYEKWVATTIGSYAWFAPAQDPRFVMIIKLERPRTSEYWESTSALIFWRIARYILDYYTIPKSEIK